MRSPCNPLCLDLLMWSVGNKANLFRKVRLLDSGHVVAAMPIAKSDIVCYIPASLVLSVDKLKDIHTGALHTSLQFGNFLNVESVGAPVVSEDGASLMWWPGMTRGHFALLSLMATLKFNVDGKGGGHAAHVELLTAQEDVLLESDIVETAAEAIDTKYFEVAAQPIVRATHKDMDEIRRAVLDCFVAFERRSVVLFQNQQSQETSSLFGLPSFEASPFVQAAARGEENGVVRGLVPIIDLCTHAPLVSSDNNINDSATCTVGFPDADICHWLALERGVQAPSKDAVLLQAVRDIREGELLTLDRGLMMGLEGLSARGGNDDGEEEEDQSQKQHEDEVTFEKWFGHKYY
jgi:hypothetical protein